MSWSTHHLEDVLAEQLFLAVRNLTSVECDDRGLATIHELPFVRDEALFAADVPLFLSSSLNDVSDNQMVPSSGPNLPSLKDCRRRDVHGMSLVTTTIQAHQYPAHVLLLGLAGEAQIRRLLALRAVDVVILNMGPLMVAALL